MGTESLPLAATLANGGWSPLTVTGASITGTNKADFRVAADGCAGRVLAAQRGVHRERHLQADGQGRPDGVLAVADNVAGLATDRAAAGPGSRIRRKLTLDPPIGPPGIVTIAEGAGFPAGRHGPPALEPRDHAQLPIVTTDDAGAFRVPVLVFHNDLDGPARAGRRSPSTAPRSRPSPPRCS